jgi:hypothetical protein
MENNKGNPKKPKKNDPKKTDGDDEERKGFVEQRFQRDNDEKIDIL